jgi:hypothetical protein
MPHPCDGETSSDEIVRNNCAEMHVYGTNQKVKSGKQNTCRTDDNRENTTSDDAATHSTDGGVS